MIQKRSAIAGFVVGGLILAFGLAMILSKDWVWSLFETLYSMLGIEAQRTNLWQMFITTIGLGFAAIGLYIILGMWKRWQK
ncbi:MAG: hypothetical protein ACK2U5_19480 [Candidatus Promineifilaceae bacterium]|jgi:hypothetical protein